MSDDLEVVWTEVRADDVVRHFVKDYARVPEHYTWFYDPAKQRFVFRMLVRPAALPPEQEGTTP
jgi:hypothetical protein